MIEITHKYTANSYTALQWLNSLSGTIALDFEAACKYTPQEQAQYAALCEDPNTSKADKRIYYPRSKADALSHPSMVHLTHLSVATSDKESFVIILHNDHMRKLVLKWLVETDCHQIWHNAGYDLKHIHYHTRKFPKSYDDAQIASKCLINHVDTFKAKVGLKELAGHVYGDWAVSADYFTLDQLYNEALIKYAAIDSCATYWIWNQYQAFINKD